MSEKIHPSSTSPENASSKSKGKIALIAAGTTIAIVCTAAIVQVFRAESGIAADGSKTATDAGAGRVRVGDGGKQNYPLARVNGEIIGQDEVAAECLARYGKEVLDGLVNRKIVEQACRQRGLEVAAAEVDAEIERIAQKFELPVESWYQMLQAERDISPMQYRGDVIWPMLALRKLAGQKVELTEKDIQQAFIREYGPRVKAKMIMFNKQRHAQKVWETVRREPENFGRLAREHSIEPTSRALDGDIPPIRRYSGPDTETLVEAAFKLKPGEISGIIQAGQPGQNRFVILKCVGHTEPVVTDINEVRDQLYAQLQEQKVQESVARIFTHLKKQSNIDNYLTNTSKRGVKQVSGTTTQGRGTVQPAGGTQTRPQAPDAARAAARQVRPPGAPQ